MDVIRPFMRHYLLFMELRGPRNVVRGASNSQTTSGVQLEHFVLHTQIPFSL